DGRQAHPIARFLCCEEGFKNPLHRGFVHANACVTHHDSRVFAVPERKRQASLSGFHFMVACNEREGASIWHGVAGVQAEVEESVLEEGGVPQNIERLIREVRFECDSLVDCVFQKLDDFSYQVMDINIHILMFSSARKSE